MRPNCRFDWCTVPEPHRHRRPSQLEVEQSYYQIVVAHPSHCSWRKDIYTWCDCGVTQKAMELEDAMKERVDEGAPAQQQSPDAHRRPRQARRDRADHPTRSRSQRQRVRAGQGSEPA